MNGLCAANVNRTAGDEQDLTHCRQNVEIDSGNRLKIHVNNSAWAGLQEFYHRVRLNCTNGKRFAYSNVFYVHVTPCYDDAGVRATAAATANFTAVELN